MKKKLLAEIEPGQIRKGVVKNIAQFGAFVDLGGIDGLLHVTDMAWGRVTDPSDVVHIDQELEVDVLKVDREKEKIALGLKQKTPSPWADVADKYPVGSRHTGEVVNVMSYGAFVKLEPGVEGLVHISEMSWTKRINHPNELVQIGDQIEVQVLNINKEKQEISLGMKQVQPNPWDKVAERYPPGHGHHRRGAQPDQLRRLHRDRGGHRRPAARQRHELGAQGGPSQRGRRKGRQGDVRRAQRRSGAQAHRAGPQADEQRPVGGRHPRPLQAGRDQEGQGHEADQLRRLRRAGAGPGGPAAHLRAGRPQGRKSRGRGQGRRRDRGRSCAWTRPTARSA